MGGEFFGSEGGFLNEIEEAVILCHCEGAVLVPGSFHAAQHVHVIIVEVLGLTDQRITAVGLAGEGGHVFGVLIGIGFFQRDAAVGRKAGDGGDVAIFVVEPYFGGAILFVSGLLGALAELVVLAFFGKAPLIVFDVAVDMVRQKPTLNKRIKIIPSVKRMVYEPTGSIYQVLSSEVATKHGLNVSACIFDELHTQPTRALYDVMTQGSGDARKQPLWVFLTTAGTDRNSICWEVHQKALDIIEGRKKDPRFYPVIFGLPDEADWTDEKNWYTANPSLGYTIAIDKVRDAFRKALETSADENMFRQLRLNQWVKQSVRWMPMDKWDACAGNVDPRALEGRACYAGLDLSSTSDLTTLVLVFPPTKEDEPYMVLPFFWLPADTLSLRVRRDHVMYDVWERQGYLMTTDGNVVHYGFIEQFICQLNERYNIREIAYDR